MADNVNDSLKNLNQNIKDADANLAKLSKDFNVVFTEAVNRAARDAKVSIDQMFDAIAGRVGASKASKLKLLFDIVDEHGKTATPQTIQQKIDRIVNATPNARGTKLHIGMDWVDVDTANANLRRYKEQLKLIQDMPAAYDLVNRAVNAIIGEFDKEAAAKQKIIDRNEKILQQEIAIEEKQKTKAAAQQQKQEEKQYKEEQKWYDAKAKADRENERRAGEAKYRQMSKEVAEYGKALQRQIELETKANQIRRDYNKIKSDLQGVSKQSEEYKKGQQVLQQYRQELHNVYQEQKKIDNEYKGTRSAVYNQQRINGLRQEYEQLRRNGRQIKENKSSLESMLPTLRRLASAFGIAFSVQGLVQFGKKLVETRGEFELQQVALRSILQNKQLADEIWDKTMQAALQSPFTAMQLTKYTKQLAAYRIETDKLFDTTKRLADVSAGLGVDMQRLILAYGQVKAANYLRASEIRQFTEAGVNMLGELSEYLTDTRGKMISTAQVMDMVQKRMITFGDVEQVFKRLTDQGGIFYNMQYVQSQTVWGQLRKLRDAYDQMLNSIGKGNEGVIKGAVSAINNIVRNWRTWAVVLKSVGWAAAIGFISKYTFAITGLSKVSISTLRNIVKLNHGLSKLGKAFAANWPALAAAGVAALVTSIISLHNRMKAANREIDEQNLRLYESRQNFEEMKSKIEENNRVIKEHKSTTETLNKAQKENRSIMQKLQNEYPQLAEQMNIATNGIIDMNGAIDTNIRKLNEQMTIIASMKQKDWFSDDDRKNLNEWEQDLSDIKVRMASVQSEANMQMMLLEQAGVKGGKLYDLYDRVRKIDLSGNILDAVSAFDNLEKEASRSIKDINDELKAAGLSGTEVDRLNLSSQELYPFSVKLGYMPGEREFPHDERVVKSILKKESALLKSYYENGIKDNANYLKEINEKYNGNITEWVSRNAKKINDGTLEGINKANETIIRSLGPQTEEMKTYLNQYFNELWGFIDHKYIEGLRRQLVGKRSEMLIKGFSIQLQAEIEKLEQEIQAAEKGVDLFSTSTNESNIEETAEEKQSKIDAAWRRRIQLLEEMRKRYEELSKSAYGYAKSNTTVRKEFDKSWGKIFGSVLSMNAVQFTSAAEMEAAFETILAKAGAASDAVKEEIQKKADSYGARIPIDVQVRIREDFGRQMEEAFGNYELTLELQKLNLPSDVLSDLFDLETVDLSDLRRKVVEFYNERLAVEADPTDLIKQVEGYYKKIDDMERKQQRDRIKDYAKYLEYELSERAKIEMEYTRKSADVAANQAFTSEQKEQIQKRLKEERDKAIAKQEWEDFKSSETYIQMMEDLEHQGTNALIAMRTELERIRGNAENLSPRALKEVVNALEKIDEITIRRGMPISNIRNAAAGVRSARVEALESGLSWGQVSSRKAAKQTQADIKAQLLPMEQQFNILQSQLGAEKEIVRLEQERYENGLKLGEIFGETFMTGDNEYLQELITNSLTNIESSQERINELTEQRKTASEADTKAIDQKLAEERANLECLAAERDLLEKQLELNIAISKEALNRAATPEERASLQARIKELEEELKKLREQDAAVGNLTKKYGILGDAAHDAIQKISSAMNDVYATTKSMMDSFGVDTDTAGWLYGDAISSTVGAISNVASKLASGDYFGAIVAGVTGIMNSIQAFNEAGDKALDKQIQIQQERIDALRDAYARLEKQIEKTWSSVSYMQTYEQQEQNIREQISAMEAQMAAEREKKNTDDNAVRQYQRDIQDAYDQLEELEQKSIEVFGGIGEEGYRSAAEGFVEAWKSAFLETGDGLQGLQDHFDEFLQDWFVKQATMRIAGNLLQPMFEMIDRAVDPSLDGGVAVTMQELEALRDWAGTNFPIISDTLEDLAGMFGASGEGSLSGLAAGIQGMTEEQANILEAYWNSVRMYTASIDQNVSMIASALGVGGNSPSTNPMLQQMSLIAANTQATHQLLQSVTRSGHSLGGYGIKVFND